MPVGSLIAEELLTSGKIQSADEMLAMGVVDVVVVDGQGEAGVNALINKRARSRNGRSALAAARRRVHRIDYSELMDIVEIWADSALKLNPRDLKLMQRLVSRQWRNGSGEMGPGQAGFNPALFFSLAAAPTDLPGGLVI